MELLLNRLIEALGPLSRGNSTLYLLVAAAMLLLAILFFANSIEASLLRAGRTTQSRFPARMSRAVRQLRTPERSLAENFVSAFYRDGTANGPILDKSDMFLFTQVVIGIGLGLAGLLFYILMNGTPLALLAGFAGYLAPIYLAERHNRKRRQAIESALPRVLGKLEMRIDSGMQMPAAIRSVLRHIDGPIASELEWASRQMTLASADVWTVLRELADRTGVIEFRTLATIMQRAARSSEESARQAFVEFAAKSRQTAQRTRDAKLEQLESKVTTITTPFLLGALMTGAFGSVIITFLNSR
jgi:Flp pilus assembly protein TadB